MLFGRILSKKVGNVQLLVLKEQLPGWGAIRVSEGEIISGTVQV